MNPRIIAALIGSLSNDPMPTADGCVVCASMSKRETGECTRCGAYVCGACAKLHLGPADQECPGRGVSVPEGRH